MRFKTFIDFNQKDVIKGKVFRHNIMMTEKELIGEIRKLRQIKPRKDWVVLTKNQILGEKSETSLISETPFSWGFWLGNKLSPLVVIFSPRHFLSLLSPKNYKPALAILTSLAILISGLLAIAQNSLPGDLLYPLKEMTEKSQAVFVSENEKPKLNLELANKRLEDLAKIAQNNRVRNLAPAINEFQGSVAQAAKDLAKIKATTSDPVILKEIVRQTQKLEEQKQKVESLGIVVGETEELDQALAQLVEREIEDLEGRTLSPEQQEILTEAKEDFQAGNYSQALEKILLISR